jgi:hypothetical protein
LASFEARAYFVDLVDAGLAQLVEHLICNQGVTGSNPVAGTIFLGTSRPSLFRIPRKIHYKRVLAMDAIAGPSPDGRGF